MLRITQPDESGSRAILRLEGSLVMEMAALLESECTKLLRSGAEVSLDLAGVSLVDRAGTEVLQRLSQSGARIFCPPGPVASVLVGAGVRVHLE